MLRLLHLKSFKNSVHRRDLRDSPGAVRILTLRTRIIRTVKLRCDLQLGRANASRPSFLPYSILGNSSEPSLSFSSQSPTLFIVDYYCCCRVVATLLLKNVVCLLKLLFIFPPRRPCNYVCYVVFMFLYVHFPLPVNSRKTARLPVFSHFCNLSPTALRPHFMQYPCNLSSIDCCSQKCKFYSEINPLPPSVNTSPFL
ncbi:hypothetical protein L596_002047 [Steinernema carpocapsae]|uniref:Uncharacterized protein n=1 Tax=Steinernema carpocapsae TaxID=34508 RepID=A0A4U8UNJ1_STECR|nr:hypothetical protein L596_002047 [Steinernema carpocapsae]